MRLPAPLQEVRRRLARLGWAGQLTVLILALLVASRLLLRGSALDPVLWFLLYVLVAWLLFRHGRRLIQRSIWRLRNRLFVAYLFIAVVPVALILVLVVLGTYMATSQVAVYLVTSELERRTTNLASSAERIASMPEEWTPATFRQLFPLLRERFPGVEMLLRRGRQVQRFPETASIEEPPPEWGPVKGVVWKGGRPFAWARAMNQKGQITMIFPISSDYLSELVPGLGEVYYLAPLVSEPTGAGSDLRPEKKAAQTGKGPVRWRVGREESPSPLDTSRDMQKQHLPPPANRFDFQVLWFSLVPVSIWDSPGESRSLVLGVRSRPSAVYGVISKRKAEMESSLLPDIFIAVAILFLLVEIVSLVIGVSLTRTITRAVHNLYTGTLKVREGDFAHRIAVRGNDQLAELSHSFNSMTENLERLVAVAQEKERLQAELEIAREVQYQLYPREVPSLERLQLTALCNPARMVSGDYYDYQALDQRRVALAIGDVAGKGISAALLMATVESSVRTQLRACRERLGAGNGAGDLSTSQLVAQLNQHLYAHTSPEKFATFYFGIYDDSDGLLTYTNAGHVPPVLIRGGKPHFLETNGIVVGAFPFAEYGESRIRLESGDLLLCYTDGLTEPENEYGEMFGEARLIDLVTRNWERPSEEILASVIQTVCEWTHSPELQDDMTLLLARRL